MFGEVVIADGKEGFPTVKLISSSGMHKCQIYLQGATLTSWICDGVEQIYLSPNAVFESSKPIRGGIPIVFPQFSQPNKSLPQHGFARTNTWEFLQSSVEQSSLSATFRLSDSEATRSMWHHSFSLLYRVTLDKTSLRTELTIVNPASPENQPFSCNALLHSYLLVPSIHDVSISGLSGYQYLDKVQNGSMIIDEKEKIVVQSEVDRIYLPTPGRNLNHLTLHDDKRNHLLVTTEFHASIHKFHDDASKTLLDDNDNYSSSESTNAVIWNGWQERCKAIGDIPDDAYLNYVCIEPGIVSTMIELSPGDSLKLCQLLTIGSVQ